MAAGHVRGRPKPAPDSYGELIVKRGLHERSPFLWRGEQAAPRIGAACTALGGPLGSGRSACKLVSGGT